MSALFDSGRQLFLEGGIAWLTDTIRIMLVDEATDTPVPATDDFFNDIAAGARKGGAASGTARADFPALGGKTSTAGVADANDVTFTAVAAGAACASLVIFVDDGAADASSPLIAYINSGTGLPVTPNGGDITCAFSAGVNKIFRL